MPWPNCQRRSTKRMSARWEKSIRQTQNWPTDYFSALRSLPGHSVSRNWRSFSHLISRQDRFPKFREDWRLEDPVDAVLSTCSTLLSRVHVDDDDSQVIQFSHFS